MTAPKAMVFGLLAHALPWQLQAQPPVPLVFQPCMENAEYDPIPGPFNTTIPAYSWDVTDVRPCLDNIKIDLHTMILTLENLFFGASTIYSFTTIVTDVEASLQSNKCGLHVHSLKIDLYQVIAESWEKFVEPSAREAGLADPGDMTAEEILDALDRPTSVAALEFHTHLNEVFARLQDAHTRYTLSPESLSPITQYLPMQFALVASDEGQGPPQVIGRHLVSDEPQHLKTVAHINGQPPLVYLQAVADRRGLYLDEGQRLNALLLGDQLGDAADGERGLTLVVGRDCDLVGSGNGSVHVSFADGSETEARWRVHLYPNDTVDLLTESNQAFVELQTLEMEKLAVRQRQLEECRFIFGCSEDIAKELVPDGPDDPQAVQAYRRLFGDWPPAETLRQVAILGAARAQERLALTPRRQPPGSEYAAEAAREVEPFLSRDTPSLRGAFQAEEIDETGSGAEGSCEAGDRVQCPGSGDYCQGDQCCPGFPGSGGGTFPCPSADGNFDSCVNNTKVFHCVEAAPSPAPTPPPTLPPTSAPTPYSWALQDINKTQQCLDDASNATQTGAVEVLWAPLTIDLSNWMVVLRMGDMVVIKMNWMGLFFFDVGSAMEGYKIAVDYARQHGITRVLIDLIGNGGGIVLLSDLLQSLFLKDYDASHLCLSYSKKVNEYWRQWILSYGDGIDKAIRTFVHSLRKKVRKFPLRISKWLARWHLKQLRAITTASNSILQSTGQGCDTFNTSKISGWLRAARATRSNKQLLHFMEKVMLRQEFVPDCLYSQPQSDMPEHSGFRRDRSGWFPFLGDEILERVTQKPFPNLTGLLEPLLQKWGDGRSTGQRYSQRGPLLECPSSVATLANLKMFNDDLHFPDLSQHRDHPFTDIAVLTDGLAGSAGSAFPSKLMASGYATVFTYGGNGKVMDSSAYAGGNVLEYADWWPRVAVAAELGMWLLPGSSWERLSRGLNYTSDVSGGRNVIYPRPMPSQHVSMRFNFNMMTVPEFDVQGDHSQLPRQFYRLPAHKHYDVWPPKLLSACENPEGLLEMYARIQREDWWEVRSNPQYLDKGWTCVPDESRKECCETHHEFAHGAQGGASEL